MSGTTSALTTIAAEFLESHPDEWLSVLAEERRLILLEELRDSQAPIDKQTLARRVAAREEGMPMDQVPEEKVRAVHISLHHHHLPRLSDVGMIEYESADGEIQRIEIFVDTPPALGA